MNKIPYWQSIMKTCTYLVSTMMSRPWRWTQFNSLLLETVTSTVMSCATLPQGPASPPGPRFSCSRYLGTFFLLRKYALLFSWYDLEQPCQYSLTEPCVLLSQCLIWRVSEFTSIAHKHVLLPCSAAPLLCLWRSCCTQHGFERVSFVLYCLPSSPGS